MATVPMDDALSKSQEMVTTMRILHGKHAEATKNHDEELAAHARTRDGWAKTQDAHDKKHEEHKREVLQHQDTRSRLSVVEAELETMKQRSLDSERVSEAARTELDLEKKAGEAQREAHSSAVKAHEEKHQAVSNKLEQRNGEFEQVNEQIMSTKSQLDSALRAQEAYRKEYHATVEALREAKEECGRGLEELARLRAERVAIDAQLKGSATSLEEARASLADRDTRLATANAELDEHRRKARCIQEEFDNVQEWCARVGRDPPSAG